MDICNIYIIIRISIYCGYCGYNIDFPAICQEWQESSPHPGSNHAASLACSIQVQKKYHTLTYHTPTLVSYPTKQQILSNLPSSTRSAHTITNQIPFPSMFRVVFPGVFRGPLERFPGRASGAMDPWKPRPAKQVNRDGARFIKPRSCWTLTSFYSAWSVLLRSY